ncbi:MAG: GspH/FimT family protein [Acinetobacter sp.]
MLALPYYTNYKARQEFQLIPIILKQHLVQAKSNAYIQHRAAVMCSSENLKQCQSNQWDKGFIIFIDNNQNKQIDEQEVLITAYPLSLKYGTLIWKGSLNNSFITFQGDSGLPRGAIGSFYYCSNLLHKQHRIILNMMGHVRTETSSC